MKQQKIKRIFEMKFEKYVKQQRMNRIYKFVKLMIKQRCHLYHGFIKPLLFSMFIDIAPMDNSVSVFSLNIRLLIEYFDKIMVLSSQLASFLPIKIIQNIHSMCNRADMNIAMQ